MAFALAPLPPQTTALQLRYNPSALSCSEVISADATHPPHGELHRVAQTGDWSASDDRVIPSLIDDLEAQ